MDQEIYHSSTMGSIPLSFTGRRLMQNLREAIEEAMARPINTPYPGRQDDCIKNWRPVSEARGRLAKYISELENRQLSIDQIPDHTLIQELQRRLSLRQ